MACVTLSSPLKGYNGKKEMNSSETDDSLLQVVSSRKLVGTAPQQ